MIIQLDLVCSACGNSFSAEVVANAEGGDRRCPRCGSGSTRQTFASYLRNGPFLDPKWGREWERAGCG